VGDAPRPTPTEITESCGDCRFAALLAFEGDILVCRRLPPGYSNSEAYRQPQVEFTDWCGYYEVGVPFIPAPPAPGCLTVPDISQVELTVVSTQGEWNGDPLSYTYAWFLSGVEDPAQVTETYTLPPDGPEAAFGRQIHCVVSATNESGTTASPPSDPLVIVRPYVPPPPVPEVVDVPAVYQEGAPDAPAAAVTCTMGNWNGEPTAYLYEWFLDGVSQGMPSAASLFNLLPEHVGKTATCAVTASNASGSTTAPASNPWVILAPVAARSFPPTQPDDQPDDKNGFVEKNDHKGDAQRRDYGKNKDKK
jgi:hypothetical protein